MIVEIAKKNWEKVASLGFAKLFEQAMRDEARRNRFVDDEKRAKDCLRELKKLDDRAEGSFLNKSLSESDVAKVLEAAVDCKKFLKDHFDTIGKGKKASDAYRRSVDEIRKGVETLSQSGKAIRDMVQKADNDKKGKMAGILVRKTRLDGLINVNMKRLAELTQDMGGCIARNDEPGILEFRKKCEKTKQAFEQFQQLYGKLNEEMRACVNT